MNYRINTYDKKYIMVNISDLAALSDITRVSNETFRITYNIYLEWIKLHENNKIKTYDIALKRNNPLRKYLTTRERIKTTEDAQIYLYENEEFREIDLSSKVKTRKRIK